MAGKKVEGINKTSLAFGPSRYHEEPLSRKQVETDLLYAGYG